MSKSGKIRSKAKARRLISFDGLQRHRKISPTDIDGIIDYKGNAFFIFEIKYEYGHFSFGQKLALKNIADALEVPNIVVLATHSHQPDNTDIIAAECVVQRFYIKGKWEVPKVPMTLKRAIELFEGFLIESGVEI